MIKREVKFDESKGKRIRVSCTKCAGVTWHEVLASVEELWTETEDGELLFGHTNDWRIIQCLGCDTISFCKSQTDSETIDLDEDNNIIYPESHELFPSRIAGRNKLSGFEILPANIKNIYEETYLALCSGQRVLSSIGIRVLIEAICKDKAAKGHKLEVKINDLVTEGHLTSSGAEILHSLRIMGNVSAHEIQAPPESELVIAFDVVENLLSNVYVMPKRAEQLMKRRGN